MTAPASHDETLFYVLDTADPDQMLLFDFPDPGPEDNWLIGQRFKVVPREPIIVPIQPGYERSNVLPYFGTPPVMSNDFFTALVDAGIDNIEGYDAVLRSEDGTVEHQGFKAFNIVGLVSAADLGATQFSATNPERMIDAGINRLAIDENKVKGLSMFRLAEYVGAVIVHRRIKRALEVKAFHGVVFRHPREFISL